MSRRSRLACVGALLLLPLLTLAAAIPPAAREDALVVTLTRRKAEGDYGTSAYSFRAMTQDAELHRNEVDLVYNTCGLVHVGGKDRVAKVSGKSLADVRALPTGGWLSSSFVPEQGAVYVMEIDDGSVRMRVAFRLTQVSSSSIKLEWTPFHDPDKALSGVLGTCAGPHDAQ